MTEGEFEKVAPYEDFGEGVLLSVELGTGEQVCLVRAQGTIYGNAEYCPHGESQMSDGAMVEDYTIECAMHYGQFDIRDGCAVEPPAKDPIQTYEVRVVDGEVWVRGYRY